MKKIKNGIKREEREKYETRENETNAMVEEMKERRGERWSLGQCANIVL